MVNDHRSDRKCKPKAEQACKLDIRYLSQSDLLHAGHSFTLSWNRGNERTNSVDITVLYDKLIVKYRNMTTSIKLTRTKCHYGGSRAWLTCPECNRRVALLYLLKNYFACRHCNNITYESRSESPINRWLRKKHKIHNRLSPNGCNEWGWYFRPKGMHNSTFNRLLDEWESLDQRISNKIDLMW